jgi:hypothetical protein
MTPQTMYAKKSDDVWIAYQVLGDVARDLVWVNAWVSHLEIMWEQPRGQPTAGLSGLASNKASGSCSPRAHRVSTTIGTLPVAGNDPAPSRSEDRDRLDERLPVSGALDHRDLPDDTSPVAQPSQLHDHVDRGRDLRPDVGHGQLDVGHHRHRLKPPQHVSSGVGMRPRSLAAETS